ncbi:hypothetical protein LguiB_008485 [Lonicera macranthoides]
MAAVPSIALYANPPTMCSNSSYDFDLSGRPSLSPLCTASPTQKPVAGGLSTLFSSQSVVKHVSSSSGDEELGPLWHEKGELFNNSLCYSPYQSFTSSIKRDQSPVSVFQGPVSCSSSWIGSSRSSLTRFARERGSDVNLQGWCRTGGSNGFVRHALGSCVDYDSPSFQIRDNSRDVGSALMVEELPFNMEDTFMESNSPPYAKDLLSGAQVRHKIFCDDVVIKAFSEAEKAHGGQMRASGDPYLQHCVETAVLLAMIGANSTVVAAGLLHDTLDDSFMCYEYISRTFGAGIADLVEEVSKLSQLSKLARESNTACKTVEADRLHTMILAKADTRAVLIKLADRLHNMMTLDALPLSKQQRFAKETLEILVPLANRLGIISWKEQIENLCFKHLNPDQHKELSSQLLKSFDEAKITSAVEKLEPALKDRAISYHVVSGRPKSLYGIYCKMSKKKLTMDEIHDIHGLRVIVEKVEDCYKALLVVHQLWSEVPGKFKDYINHPKCNGYQSLHTVVMGEGMVPLEVQIRTKEMHLQAEYGFAAHWRYKEGDCKHSTFVAHTVERARSSLADSINPSCTFPSHSKDCPYSYKPFYKPDGPVFVAMTENDKMSVQEFSANSTVVDALERVSRGSSRWVSYGFAVKEELRLRVNNELVSDPTCKLKMGDVVELAPTIPDKSLVEYREEIQRMYDSGLPVSRTGPPAASSMVGR